MIIVADKNQFAGSHGKSNYKKHRAMAEAGISVLSVPLPFGDYCRLNAGMKETIIRRHDKLKKADLMGDIKLAIDSKKDLVEVAQNVCSKSHSRFRDECILSQKVGARLIVLVEEPNIHSVRDVFTWHNPRMNRYNKIKRMHEQGKWQQVPLPSRPPVSGQTLAKAMITMEKKYGVEWQFCSREDAGKRIIEILSEG